MSGAVTYKLFVGRIPKSWNRETVEKLLNAVAVDEDGPKFVNLLRADGASFGNVEVGSLEAAKRVMRVLESLEPNSFLVKAGKDASIEKGEADSNGLDDKVRAECETIIEAAEEDEEVDHHAIEQWRARQSRIDRESAIQQARKLETVIATTEPEKPEVPPPQNILEPEVPPPQNTLEPEVPPPQNIAEKKESRKRRWDVGEKEEEEVVDKRPKKDFWEVVENNELVDKVAKKILEEEMMELLGDVDQDFLEFALQVLKKKVGKEEFGLDMKEVLDDDSTRVAEKVFDGLENAVNAL